jgi:hypothetical protein
MSLNIADLHELYQTVSQSEAIKIANLGAICYQSFKAELLVQWESLASQEDTVRAEQLRSEGRESMMETLKEKLLAVESATAKTILLEGQLQQLRLSIDAEASRRVAQSFDSYKKDVEIAKINEMSALKERIAMLEGKDQVLQMVQESHVSMKSIIESQTEQLLAYKEQIQSLKDLAVKASTKSSHALGKQGEATVLELLEGPVMTAFPYSYVKNMTSISHSADFHLWIMTESGKRKKLLIDSKKYTRSIDTKEITKLFKDIDADEDAHGGILLSLEALICTKKQFQVSNTPKQKPVLFLTFKDIEASLHKDILCWGIQSLLAIIGETDQASREKLLENIDMFLDEINNSVKELDKVIQSQTKTLEATRQIRYGIVQKLLLFKEAKPQVSHSIEPTASNNSPSPTIELIAPTYSATATATATVSEQSGLLDVFIVDEKVEIGGLVRECTAILKSKGGKMCRNPVIKGSDKCSKHYRDKGKSSVISGDIITQTH